MIVTAESVEQLAEQFAQLPGIGRKTAHRLALYIVKMNREEVVTLARALVKFNPDYRVALKKLGLLTRDARIKERKKYGKKKARRSPQWSKR